MPTGSQPVHEVKARLFRVLGHPVRVRILELLREGERSVGTLQAELGLDSGATSQHLARAPAIGVVESRREGTSVYLPGRRQARVRPPRGRPGDHHASADRAAALLEELER